MKLTHYGHAAVLVETDGGRRALIDPGTYSVGFESLTGLDLILITHAHPDHVDAARLDALREANPDAVLVGNADALALAGSGRPTDRVISDDTPFDESGIAVQPTTGAHGIIYPTLPAVANTGFVLDGSVWHPGDSFGAESRAVDVLLLPIGGPWMKVAEAIDFARMVGPRVIVPIHQGGLADVHRALHYGLVKNFASPSELVVLDEGVTTDV